MNGIPGRTNVFSNGQDILRSVVLFPHNTLTQLKETPNNVPIEPGYILAHEWAHTFGLPEDQTFQNLMAYPPNFKPYLTGEQIKKARIYARQYSK